MAQYKEETELQNDSGRQKINGDLNSKGNAVGNVDPTKALSQSSSFKDDKIGEISKVASRQSSISSTISATTRADQGRADDFFAVSNLCRTLNPETRRL